MCVKIPPGNLNLGLCPPQFTSIYTCEVTNAPVVCDGHFTGINAYGVWGVKARVQVSRRKLHTHIHLD